jgi:hypothetical protein
MVSGSSGRARAGGRGVRLLLGVLGSSVVLLVAGCGSGEPPTVEFSSTAGSVRAAPAQYCDVEVTKCENHPDAVTRLVVPPGQPVRITVPDEVAAGPWHVVFSYHNTVGADQAPVDARSPVFPPNQRHDYELVLPDPTDQLITAQVQQFGGGNPATGPGGELSFPVRGSWVVDAG